LSQQHSATEEKVGLAYWADRVLEEHSNVGGALPAQPIHDLRICLRRCMLIADLMRDLDPACAAYVSTAGDASRYPGSYGVD
jgi:hypothetical protein